MKILFLILPIICFAQTKESADVGTDTDNTSYVRHWSTSYRPGSTDLVSANLDYEYSILEKNSKGKTFEDWRALRKANRELNFRIWKYNHFVERRNRLNKIKNEDINAFLSKGNAATTRNMDETTLGFNLRTKKTQADIKGEGLEILRTLKKDLKNLKTTPELPDKFKVTIDNQILDIERQEKEWKERKWYGPSDLTPEKIEKLQKELQGTSLRARAINTLWETHQKNLKAEIEASIKLNNEAKTRLNQKIIGKGRFGRGVGPSGDISIDGGGDISISGKISDKDKGTKVSGSGDVDDDTLDRIERKTHDFNISLSEIFRKGDLADINGDLAFRNLKDWARKVGVDVKTIQNGLRTNDDFISSMKNTPMAVFIDAQIAKAFDGLCDKVRSCMINDPSYLLKESLKGVNDSSRGEKDILLGPVEGDGIRAPLVREK